MTFLSRVNTHLKILSGAKKVECGGKRCHAIIDVSESDRRHAEAADRMGIVVLLCDKCSKTIGGPTA